MKNKFIGLFVFLSLLGLINVSYGQDLLIKNGTILTVTHGQIQNGDILIVDGIIKQIGIDIQAPEGIRVVDATGKFIIPGILDSHSHLALTGINEGTEAITSFPGNSVSKLPKKLLRTILGSQFLVTAGRIKLKQRRGLLITQVFVPIRVCLYPSILTAVSGSGVYSTMRQRQ